MTSELILYLYSEAGDECDWVHGVALGTDAVQAGGVEAAALGCTLGQLVGIGRSFGRCNFIVFRAGYARAIVGLKLRNI